MTTIVPSGQRNEDEWEALAERLTGREAALSERSAALALAKSELDAFGVRYRHKVGTLHEQLEKLELEIAEIELGEISKRLEGAGASTPPPPPGRPEAAPRFTSDAVRRLFRDVAKAIHPDLTSDEATRDRRHALMIEANKAYAMGDEEQLRIILQAWERSPEAVLGNDAEAMRLRLVRRVAQVEEQLGIITDDLTALNESPLGKLKAMVDEADARGKDLVRDMIGRLKRDIMVATNRLDALRS